MPSTLAVFACVGYRRLIPRLLGQPRRMAPGWSRGSLGLPYSLSLCSMPADLPRAGRRSQLCRGASDGPPWVLSHCCPAMRQCCRFRTRALLSFCRPLRSRDSLGSSTSGSTGGKMSSSFSFSSSSSFSSFTNDGQGKPKSKSPLHKRGSLQSTTSPGECG